MVAFETSLQEARATAERLIGLMKTHEERIASAVEPELFPGGAPIPFRVTALLRAQAALLAKTAHAMAEADIAHNTALEKEHPDPRRTSLLSQEVAEKIARSVKLERFMLQEAERLGTQVEARLFPGGVPPSLSLLVFLQTLRKRLESTLAVLTPENSGTPAAQQAILVRLRSEMSSAAQIYGGLCPLCDEDELGDEMRAVLDEEG